MCTQSVGLLAGEVERRGIATVTIALVREVAVRVRPPRALAVPFRFGHPLGETHDWAGQLAVVSAALALAERPGPGPVLDDFPESQRAGISDSST